MTFGAMAAWQAWVLMAGASGLAAYLFLLKVRPRRVTVPSLLLWARVFDDKRELTLWERIRRAVSLVVAIAIALALALALVRPAVSKADGPPRAMGGAGGRVTIILDSSWSMLARTSGGTRWSRAIAEARRLAAAASGGAVALATTADGLVEGPTTDGALIESALDRLTPGGIGAAAWPNVAGSDAVYFITDGAIARPRDAGVIVRSVFESAPNVGITAFDIRPSLSEIAGTAAGQAYLEIANFGPAQPVHVTLTRATVPLLDRQFDMAEGETLRQSVPLERGGDPTIRAHVEARGNALAMDDEAFAWFERARPLAVTVVGEQTGWLAQLFARNPDVAATFVRPAAYRSRPDEVVIFDRWAPPDPPERPALYFAPPARGTWLGGPDGAVEQKPRWVAAGSHPAIRGVDPFTLTIARAQAYGSAEVRPIARSAGGTPLVYVNASAARPRLVLVTFGAGESNLTAAPAFPVLVGNALAWLSRPVDGGVRRAGLSSFDEAVVRVADPGGSAIPLARLPGEAVGVLRAPGLYTAEGGGSRATFAVNVSDPDVSNLTKSSAAAAGAAMPGYAGGQRPWWLYCAVLAFAAILGEWWTWLRRITV